MKLTREAFGRPAICAICDQEFFKTVPLLDHLPKVRRFDGPAPPRNSWMTIEFDHTDETHKKILKRQASRKKWQARDRDAQLNLIPPNEDLEN